MRHQEESAYVIPDWLHHAESVTTGMFRVPQHCEITDLDCREKMTVWCIQVVDFCKFTREAVEITMSILDRFLATTAGGAARMDRNIYQLACMSTLYTVVKIHEAEAMDPKLVSSLSRGAYSSEDIEAMEAKILGAVNWRVNPPTSLAFVRELMNVLDHYQIIESETSEAVTELAQFQTELAVLNSDLITVRASTIAYAALMNSFESLKVEEDTIQKVGAILSSALNIDRKNDDVQKAQSALYQSVVKQPEDEPLARRPKSTSNQKRSASPRSVSRAS